ncbi:MAG: hypothetical protein HKM93_12520 [Desulfobacteraceae bacterium]|nr:hypothetical protein [Desulfobacteraceae bacterium]
MHAFKRFSIFLIPTIMFFQTVYAGETHYHYDHSSRLTIVDSIGAGSYQYEYDEIGNRFAAKTTQSASPVNKPPNLSSNPDPQNGSIGISHKKMLTWNGSDPNPGDLLTYEVQFGINSALPLEGSWLLENQFLVEGLNSFTTYYWKITTADNYNAKTEGTVWSFTTGNSPPEAPNPYSPQLQANVGYPYTLLRWSGNGDPNPNDHILYTVRFGTSPNPPLYITDWSSTYIKVSRLSAGTTYYWQIIAVDNHGLETQGPIMSFSISDSDGDGMPDQWEQDFGLDPFANDGGEDLDQDGVSNLLECLNGTEPNQKQDYPSSLIEGFETGNFKKYHWRQTGSKDWIVSPAHPYTGAYSAESPTIEDNQSAVLQTTIVADGSDLVFYYTLSSEQDKDYLEFYIDDVLQERWSGLSDYTRAVFSVAPGMRTFKWVYRKDGSLAAGEDNARIDNIYFPGLSDSDGDGALDGWEIDYFGSLNTDLCADSDNDGVINLVEASHGTNPYSYDTDGDGLSDAEEILYYLDPLGDDAFGDADGDGAANIDEIIGNTDPNNPGDQTESAIENFETGNFMKFYWTTTGDESWHVGQDKPHTGAFSAQAPILDHNQSAGIETQIACRTGRIRFYISTASEKDGDILRFFIDGSLMGEWSGDNAYEAAVFDVAAGTHTFKWLYDKNSVNSEFEDTVWIDNISFPGPGDSDSDGALDAWEWKHLATLNANLCIDTDGDGLLDLEEASIHTDPLNLQPDEDADGMDDGWEVYYFSSTALADNTTDKDGDGLLDKDEYYHGTHPLKTDTDDDGYTDNEEVLNGTDPLDPTIYPAHIVPLIGQSFSSSDPFIKVLWWANNFKHPTESCSQRHSFENVKKFTAHRNWSF